MNDNCPKCQASLSWKILKSIDIDGNKLLFKDIIKKIVICPDCGSLIKYHPHPFDKIVLFILVFPYIPFFLSLYFEQKLLMNASIALIVIAVACVYKKITNPEYTSWKTWRICELPSGININKKTI